MIPWPHTPRLNIVPISLLPDRGSSAEHASLMVLGAQLQCRCKYLSEEVISRVPSQLRFLRTSTVSKTLITPGCLRVRSFRTAFFASGRRDLLATASNEKMLQAEPSSYTSGAISNQARKPGSQKPTYSPCAVIQRPGGFVDINPLTKTVWKWRPLRDG